MKILEKLFIILLLNLESLFEHFKIIDFLPKKYEPGEAKNVGDIQFINRGENNDIMRDKLCIIATWLLILLFLGLVFATPVLNFTSPTESNGTTISRNWTEINITIYEDDLDTFKFNWNTTNYSIYDDSLVLAMNFNNNSAIGENSTKTVDISKYGNNGTIYGATWTTGKFGSALSFDGDNVMLIAGMILLWILLMRLRLRRGLILRRTGGIIKNQYRYLLQLRRRIIR